MINNNIFQTSSLNIVAWLMVKNRTVVDKKKINGKTVFYFDRDETLQNDIDEYNSNVDLKKFIGKFREVKDMAKQN